MENQDPQFSPQFIGLKQVQSVENIAEKYNGTIDLVKVTYTDGTDETLTKKLYDVSITPQASDLTALRSQRTNAVTESMLASLLDWGVPLADINFICVSIQMSINAAMNTANTKLWGKAENELNLIEIDKVIKEKVTLSDLIPPPVAPGQGPVSPQA